MTVQQQALIEKLDTIIGLAQELNELWDQNTKIMESTLCCNTPQS